MSEVHTIILPLYQPSNCNHPQTDEQSIHHPSFKYNFKTPHQPKLCKPPTYINNEKYHWFTYIVIFFFSQFLQSPNYFMCANLAHPYNDDEIYTPNHNALCGQTVSSMYRLKDIDNMGTYVASLFLNQTSHADHIDDDRWWVLYSR